MNTFEILLTGFSLAMDAFTVSLYKGIANRNIKDGLEMSLIFSLFQTLMPIIGYYIGNAFKEKIINYSPILSAILLITIGILIYKEQKDAIYNPLNFKEIIILGIATSIDALVIGISFSFLENNIFSTSIIIGMITFIMCNIAYFLGNFLNKKLSLHSNKIGGITLIIIGIKNLIQDLQ